MKEFNWKTAEYPCLGISKDGQIVCFSSHGTGHAVDDIPECSTSWIMSRFKPYTPPKEKTKLWYWEYEDRSNNWLISVKRMTEEQAKDYFYSDKNYLKIEALGCIEVSY